MRQALGKYPLLNRHTGEEEIAILYQPIAVSNVDDFEKRWHSVMHEKLRTLPSQDEVRKANIQDIHWKWREKQQTRSSQLIWDSFAVECAGETQGLMFVRMFAVAQLEEQNGLPLIYIDLVTVAPWNRVGFTDTPLYKGIGPLLLGTAISLSVDVGFKGRVGLHALPQSEDWYRHQGMTELEIDGGHPGQLVYFEFSSADAMAYVSEQ